MRKLYFISACLFSWIFSNSQCARFLNVDTSFCSSSVNLTVDATILSTQLCGDSITIVFNASATALDNDTNVYFHSGPQFTPYSGWQGAYTVGTWGANNGVGRMASLGNNLWSITFNPRTYYNYPVDSCLDGIYMVFRNFNGDISVNYNNANIFVYTRPGTPTTTCPFVTPGETESTNITYHWNDANTSGIRTFTTGGNYTVTATGIGGCSATGSVSITSGTHGAVSLGGNIIKCSHTGPFTLNAGSGFVSYFWLGDSTSGGSTYPANDPGDYWITAVDSGGCITSDTITLTYSDVLGLSLTDTIISCPGNYVSLDANTSIEAHGDSLSIIYDASQGQTGLVGATKVYMHSGPSFDGQAWVGANTVGDWGLDDGVGEMDSIGNNHWKITINPYTYYHLVPDTVLTGISMVFRNANGSETGKDANGNNIVLTFSGTQVNSSFAGVYAFHASAGSITYNWSTNSQTPLIAVSTTGTYTVTVTDVNSCTNTASSTVLFNSNIVTHLPSNTALCGTATALLTPGQGFNSYNWSNGDTTSSITVTSTGVYSVTVTNATCSATASTTVSSQAQGLIVSISNGPHVVRCSTSPVTLSAASGFAQYLWFGAGPSSQTISAANPGTYWLEGIDSEGCTSYDTTVVANSSVLGLSLPDSLIGCTGDTIHTNAMVSINANGDSVVIVYDASQGVSTLVGSPKVYMHSGPEFHNGQGWVGAYTVGNWGQNDGIGEMTNIGSNLWTITIVPNNYYTINPDTPLYGIYMVFRNADGTQTGKNGQDSNIFLQIANVNPPASPFTGVTASRKAALPLSFHWSNNISSAIGSFVSSGTYTLTVSDPSSCSVQGITTVSDGQGITLNLLKDTVVCHDSTILVNAPSGFASYVWSTGASTPFIYINRSGVYYLSVTSNSGCSTSDSLVVDSCNAIITVGCGSPTAGFTVLSVTPAGTVTFKNTSLITKVLAYEWNFGDGTTSPDTGSIVHTYANPGVYTVTLVVRDSCGGVDSVKESVNVNYSGINSISGLVDWSIYPNPSSGAFTVNVTLAQEQKLTMRIFNQLGQTVWMQSEIFVAGRNTIAINSGDLAAGIYSIELVNSSESVVKKIVISK